MSERHKTTNNAFNLTYPVSVTPLVGAIYKKCKRRVSKKGEGERVFGMAKTSSRSDQII